jgi:hypothetical protein
MISIIDIIALTFMRKDSPIQISQKQAVKKINRSSIPKVLSYMNDDVESLQITKKPEKKPLKVVTIS